MFHYLVTFKTSIQAYNSAPFFGQRFTRARIGRAKIAKVYGARDSFPIPLYIISASVNIHCIPGRSQTRATYLSKVAWIYGSIIFEPPGNRP